MAYQWTELDNPAQINIGITTDDTGVGFKLELGWMWVILGAVAAAGCAIYKYLTFS